MAEPLACLFGRTLEEQVMVAGDDDLVRVGQPGEPVVEVLDLGRIGADTKKIARVQQELALRHIGLPVQPVRV